MPADNAQAWSRNKIVCSIYANPEAPHLLQVSIHYPSCSAHCQLFCSTILRALDKHLVLRLNARIILYQFWRCHMRNAFLQFGLISLAS